MGASTQRPKVSKIPKPAIKPRSLRPLPRRVSNYERLTPALQRTLSRAAHDKPYHVSNDTTLSPPMADATPMTPRANQSSRQLYPMQPEGLLSMTALQTMNAEYPDMSTFSDLYTAPSSCPTAVFSDDPSDTFSFNTESTQMETVPSSGVWGFSHPQECNYNLSLVDMGMSTGTLTFAAGSWDCDPTNPNEINQPIPLQLKNMQHDPYQGPTTSTGPAPGFMGVSHPPGQPPVKLPSTHRPLKPLASQPHSQATATVRQKEKSVERQEKPGSAHESDCCDDLSSRLFACPFWKLNPSAHHECSKFELKRFKDVKQHVKRKHESVGQRFSCLRCAQALPATESQLCKEQRHYQDILVDDQIMVVTKEQWDSINTSLQQGGADVDKWFKMWDLLFDGRPRPKSCFMGHCLEEAAPFLKRVWDNNSEKIIGEILSTELPIDCNAAILRNLAERIIHHLGVEAERTSPQDNQAAYLISSSTTGNSLSYKTLSYSEMLYEDSFSQDDVDMKNTTAQNWGNDSTTCVDPRDTVL